MHPHHSLFSTRMVALTRLVLVFCAPLRGCHKSEGAPHHRFRTPIAMGMDIITCPVRGSPAGKPSLRVFAHHVARQSHTHRKRGTDGTESVACPPRIAKLLRRLDRQGVQSERR